MACWFLFFCFLMLVHKFYGGNYLCKTVWRRGQMSLILLDIKIRSPFFRLRRKKSQGDDITVVMFGNIWLGTFVCDKARLWPLEGIIVRGRWSYCARRVQLRSPCPTQPRRRCCNRSPKIRYEPNYIYTSNTRRYGHRITDVYFLLRVFILSTGLLV